MDRFKQIGMTGAVVVAIAFILGYCVGGLVQATPRAMGQTLTADQRLQRLEAHMVEVTRAKADVRAELKALRTAIEGKQR